MHRIKGVDTGVNRATDVDRDMDTGRDLAWPWADCQFFIINNYININIDCHVTSASTWHYQANKVERQTDGVVPTGNRTWFEAGFTFLRSGPLVAIIAAIVL